MVACDFARKRFSREHGTKEDTVRRKTVFQNKFQHLQSHYCSCVKNDASKSIAST